MHLQAMGSGDTASKILLALQYRDSLQKINQKNQPQPPETNQDGRESFGCFRLDRLDLRLSPKEPRVLQLRLSCLDPRQAELWIRGLRKRGANVGVRICSSHP